MAQENEEKHEIRCNLCHRYIPEFLSNGYDAYFYQSGEAHFYPMSLESVSHVSESPCLRADFCNTDCLIISFANFYVLPWEEFKDFLKKGHEYYAATKIETEHDGA